MYIFEARFFIAEHFDDIINEAYIHFETLLRYPDSKDVKWNDLNELCEKKQKDQKKFVLILRDKCQFDTETFHRKYKKHRRQIHRI